MLQLFRLLGFGEEHMNRHIRLLLYSIFTIVLFAMPMMAMAKPYPYEFDGIGLSATANPYYFQTGQPTIITFQAQWLPNATNNYCTINCPWLVNASAQITVAKNNLVLASFLGLTTDSMGEFTATYTPSSNGMYNIN